MTPNAPVVSTERPEPLLFVHTAAPNGPSLAKTSSQERETP